MSYRANHRNSTSRLYNYLIRFVLFVGVVAIAIIWLPQVGTSRETVCSATANNVVTCQHHHRDIFWLRRMDHQPFQLQSAEVTTYQASRSDCESTRYYTAYQLDVSGLQADGRFQSVTMKSYDESHEQAYADLGRLLDLRSGVSREPLTLGDSNGSNIIPFLALCGFALHLMGVPINLNPLDILSFIKRKTNHISTSQYGRLFIDRFSPVVSKVQDWIQQFMDQANRRDQPIRCRPATTWTESGQTTCGQTATRQTDR
jgi:flavin-binding protein dodecin